MDNRSNIDKQTNYIVKRSKEEDNMLLTSYYNFKNEQDRYKNILKKNYYFMNLNWDDEKLTKNRLNKGI